jgi:hypothetical protein
MKQTKRRLILLAGSVLAGGILVLFDAPIHLVLLNTILVGFIMLILLGIVRISKKEEADGNPPEPKEKEKSREKSRDIRGRLDGLRGKLRKKRPEPQAEAAPAKEKGGSRLPDLKDIPSYLGGVVSALSANLKTWRNKESETEKIDTLLDRTIQDSLAEDFPTFEKFEDGNEPEESFEAESRISQKIDKLSSLTSEELKHLESEVNEKLFGEDEDSSDDFTFDESDLSGFDLPEPDGIPPEGNEFDDMDIAAFDSIDLPADEDFPDPDAESLAELPMGDEFPDLMDGDDESYAGTADIDPSELDNLSDLPDMGVGEDDLSDLESIDLDDIEPDTAVSGGKGDDTAPFDVDDQGPSPIAVESKEPKMPESGPDMGSDDDIGSFGFGDDDDADIMKMIKSETKRPRVVQDVSLLRDLKDVDVDTGELVEELESVLEAFSKKS